MKKKPSCEPLVAAARAWRPPRHPALTNEPHTSLKGMRHEAIEAAKSADATTRKLAAYVLRMSKQIEDGNKRSSELQDALVRIINESGNPIAREALFGKRTRPLPSAVRKR